VLLAYLFYGTDYPVVALFHSFPTYYGPEFTAKAVREWLGRIGVRTLFIEPGSPWENGYVESFIGKLRDELLNSASRSKSLGASDFHFTAGIMSGGS